MRRLNLTVCGQAVAASSLGRGPSAQGRRPADWGRSLCRRAHGTAAGMPTVEAACKRSRLRAEVPEPLPKLPPPSQQEHNTVHTVLPTGTLHSIQCALSLPCTALMPVLAQPLALEGPLRSGQERTWPGLPAAAPPWPSPSSASSPCAASSSRASPWLGSPRRSPTGRPPQSAASSEPCRPPHSLAARLRPPAWHLLSMRMHDITKVICMPNHSQAEPALPVDVNGYGQFRADVNALPGDFL